MPVDNGGCGNLRVRQPMKMVQMHTDHDTHVIDTKEDDPAAVSQALAMTDVCIVRQGGEGGIREMRKIPEFSHLKYVLDIDDNIELISPYSEHYKEYGTEEYQHPDSGVWLWKDGQRGFNLGHNRQRVASLLRGMAEMDMITVTTQKLAEYARQYNANVAVLPNCIDMDVWWKLPLKPNKRLRVGWSGGVSHYEDWYSIKEPLNVLMRKHQFTLVSQGAHFPGVIEEDNRHLVEVQPWVPFAAHSYHLMCLNLDIAVIPLADLPFNHFKSSVKWYEFSAMEVPCLVSNILPYKEDIQHGQTALGYSTPQEFITGLEALLDSAELRSRIGRSARKWVGDNRDAKTNAHLWPDAYASILT